MVGIALGLRYGDLRRTSGCEFLFSEAINMIATTYIVLAVVVVLASLALITASLRRLGAIALLAGTSAGVTLWLIAAATPSPC